MEMPIMETARAPSEATWVNGERWRVEAKSSVAAVSNSEVGPKALLQ